MTTPTTETGIVEKVARAIHDARFEGIAPEYRPHPTRDYSDHEYATRLARAAIAAMPDLTDLPRLLELQRTAAPDCPKEEGWNAALERAAEIVRSALGETSLPDSTQPETGKPCVFCPDWTAWERDLKRAAIRDAEPINDEELDRFRHALADVHCKSLAAERNEVEYRLQRFGAKMWRKILARLDAAEAPAPDSTQLLQTMAGALEQIESGAKLGSELFKARIEERKDRLTWYAVNVLQHNLDACQGTAEIALAQFRAHQEQRS